MSEHFLWREDIRLCSGEQEWLPHVRYCLIQVATWTDICPRITRRTRLGDWQLECHQGPHLLFWQNQQREFHCGFLYLVTITYGRRCPGEPLGFDRTQLINLFQVNILDGGIAGMAMLSFTFAPSGKLSLHRITVSSRTYPKCGRVRETASYLFVKCEKILCLIAFVE